HDADPRRCQGTPAKTSARRGDHRSHAPATAKFGAGEAGDAALERHRRRRRGFAGTDENRAGVGPRARGAEMAAAGKTSAGIPKTVASVRWQDGPLRSIFDGHKDE